jgi:effector-binding domain-containing protein
MVTEPKFVDRNEQPYVGIRTRVNLTEMGSGVIPQLFKEVFGWLGTHGIPPSGAPFVRYHVINMTDKLDIEMGIPIAKAVPGDGRVTASVVPAGRYATLTYTGHYDGLYEANRVLIDWAKENGIAWDRWDDENGDAFRSRIEIYYNGPDMESDPAKWETEVTIKLTDKQPQ